MPCYLKIDQPTVLKQSTEAAANLPAADKYAIGPDVEPMRLLGLVRDEDNTTGHIKFTLADNRFLAGKNTWFASKFHVSVIEEVERSPEVVVVTNLTRDKSKKGPQVLIPGVGKVHLYEPVGKSKSFFWYELTRHGQRLPPTPEVAQGMIRIAKMLQVGRDKVGKPFKITSGYRPQAINRQVGGAKQSRHTDPYGDGIDFFWEGVNKYQMYDFFNPWWPGGLGMYPHNGILHVDARPYKARWGR